MSILDKFRLQDKVALITGGSRGLGLEVAQALAQAGAHVALVARRPQYFEEALVTIPQALSIIADVSDEAQVQQAVAKTEKELGPVDILINAAGISWGSAAIDMPAEKLRQVLAVNVEGSFYACKAVAVSMRARGYGKIINFSSITALRAPSTALLDAAGYVASKGAIIAMTRDLAVKWASYGIRVNALAPGFFPSRMTEQLLPRIAAELETYVPMKRAGVAGELAGAALFLASPASDYVTGQILAVDGGYTA